MQPKMVVQNLNPISLKNEFLNINFAEQCNLGLTYNSDGGARRQQTTIQSTSNYLFCVSPFLLTQNLAVIVDKTFGLHHGLPGIAFPYLSASQILNLI